MLETTSTEDALKLRVNNILFGTRHLMTEVRKHRSSVDITLHPKVQPHFPRISKQLQKFRLNKCASKGSLQKLAAHEHSGLMSYSVTLFHFYLDVPKWFNCATTLRI
jgi:hypothetical protein